MRVIETKEPIRLKGRYLVTDPCYVYGNDDWSRFCDLLFANQELVGRNAITMFEINGKHIAVMSTAYGDGGYPVIDPNTGDHLGSFGVDAGLFAFIPWSEGSHGMRSDLGTIIEVDGVLTCDNGDAFIDGKVVVDTSGDSWNGYTDN